MAISNIPTFVDGEILTAAKLNQLGLALSTKFSGQVGGADLNWPLTAQGNLDINYNEIVNLRTLWGVINADEYDDLQDAVDALPSAGGAIFIPPNTTIVADGVDVTKPVLVFGAGKTSVLRLTGGATSGYLLRVTNTNDFDLANLTIDGFAATGSAQDGVQVRRVDGVRVHNVWFKNFSGTPLVIGNDGTAGNSCVDAMVGMCKFEGGSGAHLTVNDVKGLQVADCRFENPTTDCINCTPTSSSAFIQSVMISGCRMSNAARGVVILGGSASASAFCQLISVTNCVADTMSGNAYVLGSAAGVLRHVLFIGNKGLTMDVDGLFINAVGGKIADNYLPSAGGDGIDCDASEDLHIVDNYLAGAGALGIDGSGSTSCRFFNNDLTGGGLDLDGATTPYHGQNIGVTGLGYLRAGVMSHLALGGTGSGIAGTVTIPANTLVRAGDGIRFKVFGSSASGTGAIQVRLNTIPTGTIDLNGASRGYAIIDVFLIGDPDAASNTAYVELSVTQDDIVGGRSTITIDWTDDVTLGFNPTGFGGADALEVTSVSYDVLGV